MSASPGFPRAGRLSATAWRALDPILAVVFPSACPACGEPLSHPSAGPLCSVCWQRIPRHKVTPCSCGAPLAEGVASPTLFLSIAIGIELICGAFLLAGYRVRATAATLAVYLAALTLLIHGDFSVLANQSFAIANVGLIGGLIGLYAHGAGVWSADVARAKREAKIYGI